GAIAVAQLGQAQGKVLDGAGEGGELDGVADVVLVFDEDEDAVEHVFEEGLRPKADADADDAGGGEQRGEVDAQNVENVEQNDEADDCVGGGAQDGGDGADFGGALGVLDVRVRDAAHAVDEETDDAYEDEGDGQDDQHLREVFVDEGESVAVPVVDDIGESGVVLRREHEKEHDD